MDGCLPLYGIAAAAPAGLSAYLIASHKWDWQYAIPAGLVASMVITQLIAGQVPTGEDLGGTALEAVANWPDVAQRWIVAWALACNYGLMALAVGLGAGAGLWLADATQTSA